MCVCKDEQWSNAKATQTTTKRSNRAEIKFAQPDLASHYGSVRQWWPETNTNIFARPKPPTRWRFTVYPMGTNTQPIKISRYHRWKIFHDKNASVCTESRRRESNQSINQSWRSRVREWWTEESRINQSIDRSRRSRGREWWMEESRINQSIDQSRRSRGREWWTEESRINQSIDRSWRSRGREWWMDEEEEEGRKWDMTIAACDALGWLEKFPFFRGGVVVCSQGNRVRVKWLACWTPPRERKIDQRNSGDRSRRGTTTKNLISLPQSKFSLSRVMEKKWSSRVCSTGMQNSRVVHQSAVCVCDLSSSGSAVVLWPSVGRSVVCVFQHSPARRSGEHLLFLAHHTPRHTMAQKNQADNDVIATQTVLAIILPSIFCRRGRAQEKSRQRGYSCWKDPAGDPVRWLCTVQCRERGVKLDCVSYSAHTHTQSAGRK